MTAYMILAYENDLQESYKMVHGGNNEECFLQYFDSTTKVGSRRERGKAQL
jgi:hypothetical protein